MSIKVLIIGYGSIGRRHASVLKDLGIEVAILRSGKSTLIQDGDNVDFDTYWDLEEAVNKFSPDYAVDCSPSSFLRRTRAGLQKDFKIFSQNA